MKQTHAVTTTYAESPEHLPGIAAAVESGFPRFLLQDPLWDACWPRLLEAWPELQIFLLDQSGEPVAMVNSVAIAWDGTPDGLPAGTHAAMEQSLADRGAGHVPNTACAIQGVVDPARKGRGLAGAVMEAFVHNAGMRGHEHSVSPIRPTGKHEYPTVPLDRYVDWTRADGLPFDPWIRVQSRLNATRHHVCEDSLVIDGTISEWEEWTGLRFPDSGEYVIPGGQVLLAVDAVAGRGRYSEPHVWFEYGGKLSRSTSEGRLRGEK